MHSSYLGIATVHKRLQYTCIVTSSISYRLVDLAWINRTHNKWMNEWKIANSMSSSWNQSPSQLSHGFLKLGSSLVPCSLLSLMCWVGVTGVIIVMGVYCDNFGTLYNVFWHAALSFCHYCMPVSLLCSWLRGIRVPFCVLWSLFSFCQRSCGSGVFRAEEGDK